MNAASTLEQRVASALSDGKIGSNALSALIAEIATAIETAEKEAITAREAAIDIVSSPDPAKARSMMEAAAFTCERLRGALPRLQQRFDTLCLDEQYAAWRPHFDAIYARRNKANSNFKATFSEFAAELVAQMLDIEEIRREASRVSAAKPTQARAAKGDGCWLADGPDDQLIKAIMANLKLPDAKKPNELAWPPYRGIDIASVASIRPHPGADWWQEKQAEGARRRAEDEARAEALAQEEARVRNNPALWKKD